MRLITLNTWGGRAGKDDLLSFFAKYKDITNIFCLQEIWSAPYKNFDGHKAGGKTLDYNEIMTSGVREISAILHNHFSYFRPHLMDNYGLMALVDKKLNVVEEGDVFVYKSKGHIVTSEDIGNHARNIQYITLNRENKLLTVINFHGLWNGKGKTDTEDRIQQSKNIIEFIKKLKGEYILCGDFNLLPDTESIKLFEDYGLRNLIKEYKITSTRTSFYDKPVKYADYIFVSDGIKIKDFKVLPDEVSDHSPLLLDFE